MIRPLLMLAVVIARVRAEGLAGTRGRAGGEYLLLLRRGEHPAYGQLNDLTPCWAPTHAAT
jgi:hypothetical protein